MKKCRTIDLKREVKMNNKKKKKLTKHEKLFKVLRSFARGLYKAVCPYTLYGNLQKYNEGSLITVGNHYSYMDVVFPVLVTDKPIHFIAKQQLWTDGGLMKKFVTMCECIPVKRDGSDVQAIKECLRILKTGGVINIFPEGTRNHSYDGYLPFYGGAAALSIKTQTPIIPIIKVNKIKAFRRTHVIIGDPIEFREYYGKKVSKEQIDECDEKLRQAMWNMRLAFLERHKEIKIKKF